MRGEVRSTVLLFGDGLKIDANGYMLSRVRELNKSLIENQKQWKERVRQLEEHNACVEQETALRVGDLEGQVRDLMFYLDTQNKVEHSAHREDIVVRLWVVLHRCCQQVQLG